MKEKIRSRSVHCTPTPGVYEHARMTAESLDCSVSNFLEALIRAHKDPSKTVEEHLVEVCERVRSGRVHRMRAAGLRSAESEGYRRAVAEGRVGPRKAGGSVRPRGGSSLNHPPKQKPCAICGRAVAHYKNDKPHHAHLESWECRRNVKLKKGAA